MSRKNNAQSKNNDNVQVANVPNPPVPNRAHTEMKNQSSNCKNRAENKTENKNH